MAFTPVVSAEMLAKLQAAGLTPILDSTFISFKNAPERAEVVATDKGRYISSPANDWVLCPFDAEE